MELDKDRVHGWVKAETNILDILVMIVKTVLGNIFGQMETPTKEILVKIWDKVKEKCVGVMEVYTLGNGKEDFPMAKVPIFLKKLGTFKVKG